MSLESEAKTAAIGIDSIVRAKPTFNATQEYDAEATPARARALIIKFLSGGDAKESEFPSFDYADVKALLEGQAEKHAEALRKVADDPQVHADVTRILGYLQSSIPRRVTKSTVKQTVLPPEAFELGRFRRKWMVATRPVTVLEDLCNGSIDTGMVAAFAAMWPETYKMVKQMVDDSIAAMKDRRGENFDLSIGRNADMCVLLQAPSVNFELANDYARIAAQVPQAPAPQAKKSKQLNIKSGEALPGQVSATAGDK